MNLKFLIRTAGNIMGPFTKTKNTLNIAELEMGGEGDDKIDFEHVKSRTSE